MTRAFLDREKHLNSQLQLQLEEARQQVQMMKNKEIIHQSSCAILSNELNNRKAANKYIDILEQELYNINIFLDKVKLYNPSL